MNEDECTCGTGEDNELHPCPYAQEISGSEELCSCCRYCEHKCWCDI